MEDFAPLFGVLLTVGAMIYSSVAKARRAAKNGRTRQPQGEAWPTGNPEPMPRNFGPESPELPERTRKNGFPIPARQSVPTPGSVAREAANSGSARTPFGNDANPSAETFFPDKCRRLEEIPVRAFETSGNRQKGADSGRKDFTASDRRMQNRPIHDSGTPFETAAPSHETHAGIDEEPFDLRRAVIYAEILKPKFEE